MNDGQPARMRPKKIVQKLLTAIPKMPTPAAAVRLRRNVVRILALLNCALASVAPADSDGVLHALIPSSAFLQAGIGDQSTQSYVGGLTWAPPWQYQWGPVIFDGYLEGSYGKWTTKRGGFDGRSWLSQLGLTPVLRARPDGYLRPWFAEIGAGINWIYPIFYTGEKRFASDFQFGDHFAIGRDFGAHELAVRVEHFSNAGIKRPNPGENFVQLRYAYRFGY